MKKSIVLLAVFCVSVLCVNAQKKQMVTGSDYQGAIGLRVGEPVSVSFKYFITKPGAIEAYAGFWHEPAISGFNYFRIGTMYQHHFPIPPVEGLKWYVGGGMFAQFFSYGKGYDDYNSTILGINAVGGIDYKFKNIPLNLSADWMPTIFVGKTYYSSFGAGYGGISARYTFK